MQIALPWVFVLALFAVSWVLIAIHSRKEKNSPIEVGDPVFFGQIFCKVIKLSPDGETATVVANGASVAETFRCSVKDLRPQSSVN